MAVRTMKIPTGEKSEPKPRKPVEISVETAPIHVGIGGKSFDLTEDEARSLLFGLNRVLKEYSLTTAPSYPWYRITTTDDPNPRLVYNGTTTSSTSLDPNDPRIDYSANSITVTRAGEISGN